MIYCCLAMLVEVLGLGTVQDHPIMIGYVGGRRQDGLSVNQL